MGLANDFSDLGFVPEGANLKDIAGALRTSFGDETSRTQLDFQVYRLPYFCRSKVIYFLISSFANLIMHAYHTL